MHSRIILTLLIFLFLPIYSAFAQETSGSFTEGSVKIGYDNRTCNAGLEGSIRYNTTTACPEYCDGTAWVCPTSQGTCTSYPGPVTSFTIPDGVGPPNTPINSTERFILGITDEVVHACATGGTLIRNGTDYGTGPVAAVKDSTIGIKVTTPATPGSFNTGTLTIGTQFSTTFRAYTATNLYCWGHNRNGSLGDNTTTDKLVPTALTGGGQWLTVSTGGGNWASGYTYNDNDLSCGIKIDGTLWCWGFNGNGQLGDNTTISKSVPTAVSGGGTWTTVSAGSGVHACGIKTDGTLWCWGYNGNGHLGIGNTVSPKLIPQAVSGGGTWTTVGTGYWHSCGIKTDGSLYCWGYNGHGQVGDNSTTQRTSPVAVSGGGTWTKASAGGWYYGNYGHSCGIKTDGTLWCWGYNGNGQLGDGTTTNRLVPTQVSGGGTWTDVTAGNLHTCGRKTDGTLWCWGYNAHGQVGDNTTTDKLVPTAVSGGATWNTVAAGAWITCGIKTSDVRAYCWGYNNTGDIGDGTTAQRLTPTAVSGTKNPYSAIASGGLHTCAIAAN